MAVEIFDMETPLGSDKNRADDVVAIADLWRQIGDDNTSSIIDDPELLRSLMAGLDYLVLRHPETTRPLGAVSVMNCRRNLAKIDSLAVHPEHQHQGHGHTLAESAIRHCVRLPIY